MAPNPTTDLRAPFVRLAFVLVLGLAGATALAVLGATGPGVLELQQAIFGLAAALLVIAVVSIVLMVRVGQALVELRELRAENEAIKAQLSRSEEDQHVILLDGLGERYASRLNSQGIITVPQLLSADAGRVAAGVGVSAAQVEDWQAMGRFLQVQGVTPQAAGALVRSGVRTVAELARAKPGALAATIQRSTETRNRWPGAEHLDETIVGGWVQGARRRLNTDLRVVA